MGRSDITTLPRIDERRLADLADSWDISLTEQERSDYTTLVNGAIEGMEPVRESRSPSIGPQRNEYNERPPASIPDDTENPGNVWIRTFDVPGAESGPLSGKTVGLKDSIALLGYPMTNGSDLLSDFIPEIDATVATRLLDAGASIVGKNNMESFAWSGSGDTSDFGPVANPRDDAYLSGGSSSGSAAAVARGECDIAIGTDVAGSVRIPSAWCGIVGLKPTHGLVPMTGVIPTEHSLDHVGPMAATTGDVGLALDAIAGVDTVDGVRLDPRQPQELPDESYGEAATETVERADIAVLDEGFDWEFSNEAVDETVRGTLDSIERFDTEAVSVPIHRDSIALWATIANQGGVNMLENGGVSMNHRGWVWERLGKTLQSRLRSSPCDLPPSVKFSLFTVRFLEETLGTELYGRARNLTTEAHIAFRDLLAEYDAVALPTVGALPLEQAPDLDRPTAVSREIVTIANTCLFDLTGHPAISVPCGTVDGLPVGLMFVGAEYDESTLLRLAATVEQATE